MLDKDINIAQLRQNMESTLLVRNIEYYAAQHLRVQRYFDSKCIKLGCDTHAKLVGQLLVGRCSICDATHTVPASLLKLFAILTMQVHTQMHAEAKGHA